MPTTCRVKDIPSSALIVEEGENPPDLVMFVRAEVLKNVANSKFAHKLLHADSGETGCGGGERWITANPKRYSIISQDLGHYLTCVVLWLHTHPLPFMVGWRC